MFRRHPEMTSCVLNHPFLRKGWPPALPVQCSGSSYGTLAKVLCRFNFITPCSLLDLVRIPELFFSNMAFMRKNGTLYAQISLADGSVKKYILCQ